LTPELPGIGQLDGGWNRWSSSSVLR